MEFQYLCRTRMTIPEESIAQFFLRESSLFWNMLLSDVEVLANEYVFGKVDADTSIVASDMAFKAEVFALAENCSYRIALGKRSSLYVTSYMFRANDLYEAYRRARSESGIQREACLPRKKHLRSSHSVRFIYGDYKLDAASGVVSFRDGYLFTEVSDCNYIEGFRLDRSLDPGTLEEIIEKKAMMTITTRRLNPVQPNGAKPAHRRRSTDVDDILPPAQLLEYTITFSQPMMQEEIDDMRKTQAGVEVSVASDSESVKSKSTGPLSRLISIFKSVSINDGKQKTFMQSLSTELFNLQPKLISELGESCDQAKAAAITADIESYAMKRIGAEKPLLG